MTPSFESRTSALTSVGVRSPNGYMECDLVIPWRESLIDHAEPVASVNRLGQNKVVVKFWRRRWIDLNRLTYLVPRPGNPARVHLPLRHIDSHQGIVNSRGTHSPDADAQRLVALGAVIVPALFK